jgi:4,5-dihydroxyphthalate decarboxylase
VRYSVAVLTLKTALDTYGHTASLKDGSVLPHGVTFDLVEVQPIIAAFRRMVRTLEFDMCEMAITTYMTARAYNKPFTALPVFVHRMFNHSALVVNAASGIQKPQELSGKRVGVRAYTVTQGVWTRGLLGSDYGVAPDAVTWVLVDEEHVQEFREPPNVVLAEKGATLKDLLLSGEIDAAIGVPAGDPPEIRPLIANAAETEAEWSRRVGFTPINHLIVVKDALLAAEPWLAQALFEAFNTAKARSLKRIETEGPSSPSDKHIQRLATISGGDPLPYGIDANRKALDTIITYAYEQHILPARVAAEELFVRVT